MKKIQRWLVLLLVCGLVACSSEPKNTKQSRLPAVQQEYLALEKWVNEQDTMDKILARIPSSTSDEQRVQIFMQAYRKNLSEAKKSAPKLGLKNPDVKRMQAIYLELLTLSESTMPAFIHSTPPSDAMWRLQSITPKLNQLEQEFETLQNRVRRQFK